MCPFMRGQVFRPRHVETQVLVWLVVFVLLGGFLAPAARAAGDDVRDFPPLADPNRPSGVEPAVPPGVVPEAVLPDSGTTESAPEPYLLGVGDEMQVSVLSAPELSGIVKVRPDGAITTPGAGTIHALGRTPEDVGREVEGNLGEILRHARVDVIVTGFGDRRIFVMGEVGVPGDKPYYRGMSALQAVAAAGGVLPSGKAGSVLVLRRTGTDEAEIRRLDLGRSLGGKPGPDMILHPFDIVYVPRTLISRADLLIDRYVRQMMSPFSLYLEGWKAFNIGTSKVNVVATP
jgi:protein involved in polysaccharide export with SLBB domain